MKIILLALAMLTVCVSASLNRSGWPPRSTGPTFPRPPGQLTRIRRESTGSIGVVKYPGRRPDPTVQIQGNWRFRREADSEGTISELPQLSVDSDNRTENSEGSIPEMAIHRLGGPDRQSTFESDYQPEIHEGNHRSIRASDHKVKSTKGVGGRWRFRREAVDFVVEPETLPREKEQMRPGDSVLQVRREVDPEGSIPEMAIHRLGDPDPQSTLYSEYQPEIHEGNHRSIRASDHKVKSTKGVGGRWRFRREADDLTVEPETLSEEKEQMRPGDSVLLVRREVDPEGSIPEMAIHRLGGVDPQSTLYSEYQPEIYEGNHRSIRASDHKVKSTKGVGGRWRFRREADDFVVEPETLPKEKEQMRPGDSVLQVRREVDPEGSIPEMTIHRLGDPDPQSTLYSEYQPEIHEGNHRSIRASDHKVKSTKGVGGRWRFRREADDFAVEPETLLKEEEQTRLCDSELPFEH